MYVCTMVTQRHIFVCNASGNLHIMSIGKKYHDRFIVLFYFVQANFNMIMTFKFFCMEKKL